MPLLKDLRLEDLTNHGAIILLVEEESLLILDVNETACRYYGYGREELVGAPITRLNQLPVEKIREEMANARSERRNYFLFPHRRKDGEIREVEVYSSPVLLEGRRLLLSIIHDISEKRALLDRLAESRGKYLDLVESQPDPICCWDPPSTRLTYVNRAYCRMVGRRREELIGTPWADLLPPDLREAVRERYRDVGANPRVIEFEHPVVTPSGRQRWERWIDVPILDAAGRLLEYQSVGRDLTEIRTARRELERLRRALWTIALSDRLVEEIEEENEYLAALCRALTEEGDYRLAWVGVALEGEGKAVRPLTGAGRARGYLEGIRISWDERNPWGRGPTGRALREGRPVVVTAVGSDPGTLPWRDRAESFGIAALISLPLEPEPGDRWTLNLYSEEENAFSPSEAEILEDLARNVEKGLRAIRRRAAHRRTEQALREAEARYVQAQRMEVVGRLAEGVAHDFNNILQVILGSLEVLQMDLAPANPIREELRPIEEAARRASELVRQLLAFGRKEPADPRPLDLNALAEALQRLLRRVVRKDIVLELRLDPRTPSVRGDYLQIEQALMNLCVNAQDALEGRGGTIRIETGRVEGPERAERARDDPRFAEAEAWAVLTVRDDGPGVPEAIRERIFEPFFSAREGGRGTGLGLATAYWVARQHRGFATLDPQESGAAFSLYLPLSG